MFNNQDKICAFLNKRIQKMKIAVIGDVMLDKYYFGEVKRISPEAPVPVTRVTEEKHTLGGAANVAANLAKLGAKVFMGGVSGQDENRAAVAEMFNEYNIDYSGVMVTERPTITKLRVIGAHQQMMRLDFEEVQPLAGAEEDMLINWFDNLTAELDGVIISDYAKGVCTPRLCRYIIESCKKTNIPVLVDPKGSQWDKYRGASFITPNVKELGEAFNTVLANEDDIIECYSNKAGTQFDIKNVVITRSEKGLSVVNGDFVLHIPTVAQEVFDVSGAGDTVAACLLCAVAGGVNIPDAARLANMAAGVVVGRVGTYPISRLELINALSKSAENTGSEAKIMSWDELNNKLGLWRAKNLRIVFTNGCFDILHTGHVAYLEKAKNMGDKLIIGVNSDASVKRLKGELRPIVGERDRARLLASLACVDAVVFFDSDTPAEIIGMVQPDVLAKGGDYAPDEVVGRENAGRVEIIKFEDGYSTTGLINKILAAYKGDEQ